MFSARINQFPGIIYNTYIIIYSIFYTIYVILKLNYYNIYIIFMNIDQRILARKNLDKRLNKLRKKGDFTTPPKGWIKAIREALGMTTAQLGKRIGVSQPRALNIERAEIKGTLTLTSLERAAHALDCRLVYAFIPKESLNDMVRGQAEKLAITRLRNIQHTMGLEDQAISKEDASNQLEELVDRIAKESSSEIWDEQ